MQIKNIEKLNINKQKISRLTDERFADLESLIINELDVDFSTVKEEINTLEEFNQLLREPFLKNRGEIFYRGERVDERNRPLIPTIFRNRKMLFDSNNTVAAVDANFVFDFYKKEGDYLKLYKRIMGTDGRDTMYRLCSFSQHYLDVSPFVDFSKSLYVSLSFALKDRKEFDKNIVLYTVKIKDMSDYTQDESVADLWMENYNVYVFRHSEDYLKDIVFEKSKKLQHFLRSADKKTLETLKASNAPSAKMIDIPTNDLMRFQQGVFLLLTDFKLVFNAYPTKSIRDDFEVTKWVINKDICPYLVSMIEREAPWYSYDCLLDVKKAFKKARKINN